jgi:predicted DNA-binding protein with PD1-like motif
MKTNNFMVIAMVVLSTFASNAFAVLRPTEKNFMINLKQLTYSLLLGGFAMATGYSQDTAEYVAPPDAGPKGKAPRMKVQLLNDGEPTKQYAVIFYQGDEAFSGLLEFAQKYHVTSAHFTAIGAVNGATLGWFDPQRKMYKKIPINGQHEVIGMSGDIALYQGKPVVHTHMLVGRQTEQHAEVTFSLRMYPRRWK